MTRRIVTVFILLLCATCEAQWTRLMPSALGDARLGRSLTTNANAMTLITGFRMPTCEAHSLTFTGWYQFSHATSTNIVLFPMISYTPGPVSMVNPDILGNAGCHTNGGFTLDGVAVFTNVVLSAYPDAAVSNTWPSGVYTVDGESEQSITVSVGGNEVNLGPGTWTRNVIAGPSEDITVSGAGHVRIGVSKTPCHEFFQASGAHGTLGEGVGNDVFTQMACSITNDVFTFWSVRIELNASNHVYTCRNIQSGGSVTEMTATNTLPVMGERIFTDRGIYQLFMIGAINETNKLDRYFDQRVNCGWLSNEELDRVWLNGLEEIQRRGL